MKFDKEVYEIEKITVGNETIEVRAFRNRVYVDKPVNEEFQQMNIFSPEIYYQGGSINGFSLHTAPVFMPNMVGGYMPGGLGEPSGMPWDREGVPNTMFLALQHGYVVAVPAIRGRVLQNELGEYTGKAPACIVDYKAAVRYLRHFSEDIPGDVEKIITNGTSAGGALSSLMGSTGNHPDYEGYLEEIGAAKERDDIFAASCYCPITNLEHADMAYEWQFQDVTMPALEIKVAEELAKLFPAYVNSLCLQDENGRNLELDEEGNGSFKEYMKKIVQDSAQSALDSGVDISEKKWLEIKDKRVRVLDWHGYAEDITRMKAAPAFDALSMNSPENDLFGSKQVNLRHFTDYGKTYSHLEGQLAEPMVIKLMNPMNYVEDSRAVKAKNWRIRHGECDRDTSLAISAILSLKLKAINCEVDYHSPWNVPHAGDYDLEELFLWIDTICR